MPLFIDVSSSDDRVPVDAALDGSVVVEALQRLSPAYREVLVEAWVRRDSLEVIAARLGVPVGTVRVRLHYALRELRREFDLGQVARSSA